MPGSVPLPCGGFDEGTADAAGNPHKGRGRHQSKRGSGQMAQTAFSQPYHSVGVCGDAEIPDRTVETDYTDSGFDHEGAVEFGSGRVDVAGAGGGSAGVGHYLQSR